MKFLHKFTINESKKGKKIEMHAGFYLHFHSNCKQVFGDTLYNILMALHCLEIRIQQTHSNQDFSFNPLTQFGEPRCDYHNALQINIFFSHLVLIQIPETL